MSVFLGTLMFGHYCNQEEVVAENGPTASVCYAKPLVDEYVGFGIWKIMYGRKFIRSSKSDGCTLMHVKRPGITLGFTLKVGRDPWSPCHPRLILIRYNRLG